MCPCQFHKETACQTSQRLLSDTFPFPPPIGRFCICTSNALDFVSTSYNSHLASFLLLLQPPPTLTFSVEDILFSTREHTLLGYPLMMYFIGKRRTHLSLFRPNDVVRKKSGREELYPTHRWLHSPTERHWANEREILYNSLWHLKAKKEAPENLVYSKTRNQHTFPGTY